MTVNRKQASYFLLGALILFPLQFSLFGTQIFFVQTILMFWLVAYHGFARKAINLGLSKRPFPLDLFVYLYILWVLVSFLLNFIFSFDGPEIQIRRLFSLAISLLLFSGYLVGRALQDPDYYLDSFVKGIFFMYLLILAGIGLIFIMQPSLDLYVVKGIIGQRLPFVIGFVATLGTTYFFLQKTRSRFSLLIMMGGVSAVILSLTRAAYIQLFISFFILFIKEIRRYFVRTVFILILVFLVAFGFFKLFGDMAFMRQITSRIELLVNVKEQSTEDASGSVRLEIWRFLGGKLAKDPVRIVIGYGQLGPSHLTKDFVSADGTSGNNAHNQYLDIVIREGVIGLFFFLLICYKIIVFGLSKKNIGTKAGLFIHANSLGLAGVMFYGIFHETVRYPLFGFYFWLYIGIVSGLVRKWKNESQADNNPAPTGAPAQDTVQ